MSAPYRPSTRSVLHGGLEGILDVLDLVELDVDELAAHPLYPTNVDGLDHVTGLRIDRHRAARAFPTHPLRRRDQRFGIGRAAGLLERLVDDVHAVIRAGGEHVRVAPECRLVV